MSNDPRVPLADDQREGRVMEPYGVPAADMPRDAVELEGPLVLRDGTVLHQRAIRPDDGKQLQALHGRLSHKAIVFRFFGALSVLSTNFAEYLSHVDYEHRMAVVATAGTGAEERIVAVVRYAHREPETAEVALAVEDHLQGQGIASQLLWTLAGYARRRGYTALIAEVMPDNERMLRLLRHCGLPGTYRLRNGYVEWRIDIFGLDARQPLAADVAPPDARPGPSGGT